MKKRIKIIQLTFLISVIYTLFNIHVMAAPFSNIAKELVQPNGEVLNCYLSGDEYFNYYHDEEGFIIIEDETTGYYTYGMYNGTELIPADNKEQRIKVDTLPSEYIDKVVKSSVLYDTKVDTFNNDISLFSETSSKSVLNNAVIYIYFQDSECLDNNGNIIYSNDISLMRSFKAFKPIDKQIDKFHNIDGNVDNLSSYFKEVSYGKMEINSIVTENNSITDNELKFVYQAQNTRDYYKDGEHTDELYKEAVLYFEQELENEFEAIEANSSEGIKNSYKITFVLIGTGIGVSHGDPLWPHARERVENIEITFGDRTLSSIEGIVVNDDDDSATLAHEFLHIIGCPDYYKDSNNDSYVGGWDIMSDVSCLTYPSAYTMWKHCYWLIDDGDNTITESGEYELYPLETMSDGNQFYIIYPEVDSREYFIVEYRKKISYDYNIKSEGLVIYRANRDIVDSWYTQDEIELEVIRPEEGLSFAAINSGDLNSYDTNPQILFSNGKPVYFNISNIQEIDGKLKFNVNFEDITELEISNEIVKKSINSYLGQPEDRAIYAEELYALNKFIYPGGDEDTHIFKYMTGLKDLTIAGNVSDFEFIRNIPDLDNLIIKEDLSQVEDFSKLCKDIAVQKKLKTLKFENCNIVDISWFSYLNQMEEINTLNLTNNKIEDISCLGNLSNVYNLILSNNNITSLSGLEKMNTVVTLDLSGNKIRDLYQLRGLSNIENLNLSNNYIRYIDDLYALDKLNSLNISHNRIENVENVIRDFNVKMTELGKSVNISSWVGGELIDGDFLENEILQVDFNDEKLENVVKIQIENMFQQGLLSDNNLSLDNVKQITSLSLTNSDVKDLGGIEVLTGLKSLDLSENDIDNIDLLRYNKNLEELNLFRNEILDISTLSVLDNLKYLYLAGNNIQDYSGLTDLYNTLLEKDFKLDGGSGIHISTIAIKDGKPQFHLKFDDVACERYYYKITTDENVMEGEIIPEAEKMIFSDERIFKLENLRFEIFEKEGNKPVELINFIVN